MVDVTADTIAIIAGKVRNGLPAVQPTDKLVDLGLDSLAVVELIFEIEEKFDITIDYNANDKQADFDTVAEVVRAVQGIVDGKA